MKTIKLLFGFLLFSQILNAQTHLDSLKAKAMQGDVAAMWEVGNYYDGIDKIDSAEYWLLNAYQKDKNNAKGLYYLGLFYSYKNKGKKYLKKSAELGNINAALTLFEVSKPKQEDVPSIWNPYKKWKKYQKDEGECKRYASLALSLTPGEDFHSYINLADAADWIGNVSMQKHYALKALNNGEYGAISYMAKNRITPSDNTKPEYLYEYADYIRKNVSKVDALSDEWVSLYLKSAQKGYAPAQLQTGLLFLRGYEQEIKTDTLKAIAWFKESAKNGNANARVILASFYQQGLYCQKNPELAFNMFKHVADTVDAVKTCAAASYQVGLCYYYGLGVKKDYSLALKYLLKAVDKQGKTINFIDIVYVIGCIYFELDDTKAFEYLKTYSDCPINTSNFLRHDALKKIGLCYRFGKCGVEQDVSLADKYDATAARFGDFSSQNIQDTVMERAISTLLNYSKI